MYLMDYIWFALALLVCMIFAAFASARVKSAFAKHDKTPTRARVTGYEAARRLMQANGVDDITIGQVAGSLSDHYHPAKKTVNLSQSTYSSSSVAAVAVAAHEIGHVMQKKNGYLFYNIRTAVAPITRFGSYLAMPLVMVGLIMDFYITTVGHDTGFYVAMVGVILYGASFLFTLVTLPVELNASKRAKEMLLEQGILSPQEMRGAEEVLSAAALTYLASMLTSLVYFLRFLLYVLSAFGKRND